jgi:hypothetical protein
MFEEEMRKYHINTAAEWNAIKNLKYRRCLIEFYSQRVTKRKCTQQKSVERECRISNIFPLYTTMEFIRGPPEDQKARHQCSSPEAPPVQLT